MPTYNPGTPQGPDLPSESQDEFLSNFSLINQFFGVDHIPFGNTVTNATSANPCVCTSPNHGLTTGNPVMITHFASLIGDIITPWSINGGPYTATVIDANTFSLNVSAAGQKPYLANTGAFSSTAKPYGFHTKTFFPAVQPQGPNTTPPLASPYSAYYSKLQGTLAELFFQNGVGASFEKQLTQLPVVERSNANGKGILTPWGVIINFGSITFQSTSQQYDLPIPFTSAFWSIVGTLNMTTTKKVRPFWQMNAVGLTKFSAVERTGDPETTLHKVPGWYIAIGV